MTESSWPSKFGTLGDALGMNDLPNKSTRNIINDEMPPTKHPITGEYFTSKAKFRAVNKRLGYEEVGNSYQNGVDPYETEYRDRERATDAKIKQNLIDKYYGRR